MNCRYETAVTNTAPTNLTPISDSYRLQILAQVYIDAVHTDLSDAAVEAFLRHFEDALVVSTEVHSV